MPTDSNVQGTMCNLIRRLRFDHGEMTQQSSHLPTVNATFVQVIQVPLPRMGLAVMLCRARIFPPFIHSRRS